MAMATFVFTFVLLTFGAIFVDAENYVTQEQLRELMAVKDDQIRAQNEKIRELSEKLDQQQTIITQRKGK